MAIKGMLVGAEVLYTCYSAKLFSVPVLVSVSVRFRLKSLYTGTLRHTPHGVSHFSLTPPMGKSTHGAAERAAARDRLNEIKGDRDSRANGAGVSTRYSR